MVLASIVIDYKSVVATAANGVVLIWDVETWNFADPPNCLANPVVSKSPMHARDNHEG